LSTVYSDIKLPMSDLRFPTEATARQAIKASCGNQEIDMELTAAANVKSEAY